MINLNTNKILIPVDFSITSMHAISHGAPLVKLTKGKLILLHVQKKAELLELIIPALKLKNVLTITKYLECKVGELAKKIKKEYNIPVIPMLSMGNIASEITKTAEDYKAGMIIMGTHGGDSASDLFLGSNAYRVLTKSSIPVMTVRTMPLKGSYENILLPIDLSEHSRQKVTFAMQLAATCNAHVHAIGLLAKNDQEHKFKLEVILPQVQKVAKKHKVECSTEIIETTSKAKTTLDCATSKKADLIITMEDQGAELSRFILGSYAHQLIDNSQVPVLSIPPDTANANMSESGIGGLW
jgi:nucleotide-binding universal stress UspA family protein